MTKVITYQLSFAYSYPFNSELEMKGSTLLLKQLLLYTVTIIALILVGFPCLTLSAIAAEVTPNPVKLTDFPGGERGISQNDPLPPNLEQAVMAELTQHKSNRESVDLFTESTNQSPQLPNSLREKVLQWEAGLQNALDEPDKTNPTQSPDLIGLAEKIVQIREKYQGAQWWETINAHWRLNDLQKWHYRSRQQRLEFVQAYSLLGKSSALLSKRTQYNQARVFANQGIKTIQKILGENHPTVVLGLRLLAVLYEVEAKLTNALSVSQQALVITAKAYGPIHPAVALSFYDLGHLHFVQGEYAKALPYLEKALSIQVQTLATHDADLVETLKNLSGVYEAQGKSARALAFDQWVLTILVQSQGLIHPDVAQSLISLGQHYLIQAKFSKAQSLFEGSLAIHERALSPNDPKIARSLGPLGQLFWVQGQYLKAQPLFERALYVYEQKLEQNPVDLSTRLSVSASLRDLATLHSSQGRYAEALALNKRNLTILEQTLGPDHPSIALGLSGLAKVYREQGLFREAIPLMQRALAIEEETLGADNPGLGNSLRELGLLYFLEEQFGQSLPLLERAFAIRKKAYGPLHPALAVNLYDLGYLHFKQGQYAKALPLLEKSLAIREKAFGPTHPSVSTSLNLLALIYKHQEKYNESLLFFERALSIVKQARDKTHPDVAMAQFNLGLLHAALGQSQEAELLLLRAAEAQWTHFTLNFPSLSSNQKRRFSKHSGLYPSEHIWNLQFGKNKQDTNAGFNGVLLRKQLFFEAARQESSALLANLATAPAKWQMTWKEFQSLRRQYGALTLRTMAKEDSYQKSTKEDKIPTPNINELAKRIQLLDQELRQTNPAYAQEARLQRIRINDVRAALRPGQAVVEYVRYQTYDFSSRKAGSLHYGAFVLVGGENKVHAVPLGTAEGEDSIDTAVHELRATMVDFINSDKGPKTPFSLKEEQLKASETKIAEASDTLRRKIWDPLQDALKGVTRVYIAPDGLLSLVPFEMLAQKMKEGGWQYLVEDHELVYLNTSRDLARLALRGPADSDAPRTAVLISNPNAFASPQEVAQVVAGLPSPLRITQVEGTRSTGTSGTTANEQLPCATLSRAWGDLGGSVDDFTSTVSNQLTNQGWSVTTRQHNDAVEDHVLQLQSPRLLQFTTHGIFLDCPKPKESRGWDNPLLRSMLVLTGAVNKWDPHQMTFYHEDGRVISAVDLDQHPDIKAAGKRITLADGLLTAYDVTGMNLQGTELVNLTACETGLGDVTPDGVIGLRQAFLLAGARSLTMSMWEIPTDESTKQTQDFYNKWLPPLETLQSKKPQSEKPQCLPKTQRLSSPSRYQAFREAQLEALCRTRNKKSNETHEVGHPFYWAGTVYVGDPGDLPTLAPSSPLPTEKSSSTAPAG